MQPKDSQIRLMQVIQKDISGLQGQIIDKVFVLTYSQKLTLFVRSNWRRAPWQGDTQLHGIVLQGNGSPRLCLLAPCSFLAV